MAEKRKLAFYIRLSDADEEVKAGTKDESNSITGQRKLLYAYIKKTEEFAGFEVLEYFDDGYSGTMFNNRAEFQRLIQDAELGGLFLSTIIMTVTETLVLPEEWM